MKKTVSIFLIIAILAISVFYVMTEVYGTISEKDLKRSDELVNQFLVAMRDLDFDSYINVLIDESFPDRDEMYDMHKSTFDGLRDTEQQFYAFEIIDKAVIDKRTVKYTVKLYEKSGVVWQGARYTKKIKGKWYVYQYEDLEKHRFDVIEVPEHDRERFERAKRLTEEALSASPKR